MPTQVKYGLIEAATSKDNNLLSIHTMCTLAGVSRSGYYRWLANKPQREQREKRDWEDFQKILKAYESEGYPKGSRAIHMVLLHRNEVMNVKKINRLKAKYGLRCPIRQKNKYREMAKRTKSNAVFPNIVDRQFKSKGARKILLTDITYLFYGSKVCYLSVLMDAYTREVLAWQLSRTLAVGFVLRTVDALVQKHGCELDDSVIVHSDQGFHYTSKAFIAKLRDESFVQSMSRKGNCWDNAPQENFFGHMKDEIRMRMLDSKSYEEVEAIVEKWMDYYNNRRYQWGLQKLSPREYYDYVTTGKDPLAWYRGSAPNPGG